VGSKVFRNDERTSYLHDVTTHKAIIPASSAFTTWKRLQAHRVGNSEKKSKEAKLKKLTEIIMTACNNIHNEWIIGKDTEGSFHCVIWGNIPAFIWTEWTRPSSITVAC